MRYLPERTLVGGVLKADHVLMTVVTQKALWP
jgi:hypothetical protein